MSEQKIKFLNYEETKDLIQGIEDGEIFIFPRERTPEEDKLINEAIRKHRKEYWDSMTFIQRLKKKWHLKYLCYKYRFKESKFANSKFYFKFKKFLK